MGLDWEEGLFATVLRVWRRFRPAPGHPPHVALLAGRERHLTLLTQLIAGVPVTIRIAEGVGGVRGDDLLMPPMIATHPDRELNEHCYTLRALIGGFIIRDRLDEKLPLDPRQRLTASTSAWQTAQERMLEELPGTRRLLIGLPTIQPGAWHCGELMFSPAAAGTAGEAQEPRSIPGTEIESPARDTVSRVELDTKEAERSVLMAPYERVETVDSWKGGARDADASDELEDHAEALAACDLHEVVRGGDPPGSLYRCDLQIDAEVGEVDDAPEGGIPYDEWDHRRHAYRPGWCRVHPLRWTETDPAWARHARQRLSPIWRRALHLVTQAREPLRARPRETDGDDIDLDAWVREMADRQTGHGGEQRLWRRLARPRRDWACSVLIDVSLSADSGVAGKRVLDLSRDAVMVLGEIAESLGDRLEVLAFASQTRNHCRVWEVRRFQESWALGAARIGGLRPQGYTRIGPAIRHATARLKRVASDRRLLFLLSDGKPTDHDRYEGRYGVADIRRAVAESRAAGIHLHAFAVDAVARAHLPAQFGTGCWTIMPDVDYLPEALARVYGRITAR